MTHNVDVECQLKTNYYFYLIEIDKIFNKMFYLEEN